MPSPVTSAPSDLLSRFADRLEATPADPRLTWRRSARPDQLPPPGNWRTWLVRGTRDGKLRQGRPEHELELFERRNRAIDGVRFGSRLVRAHSGRYRRSCRCCSRYRGFHRGRQIARGWGVGQVGDRGYRGQGAGGRQAAGYRGVEVRNAGVTDGGKACAGRADPRVGVASLRRSHGGTETRFHGAGEVPAQ